MANFLHKTSSRNPFFDGKMAQNLDGYVYKDLRLEEIKHLEYGSMIGFATIDACRGAWEARRDVLLPNWIRRRPGTRPAAWWLLECPLDLESDSIPDHHFGRVVPALVDQRDILALHNMLTEAELSIVAEEVGTAG